MSQNQLTSLDAGLFSGLNALTTLWLQHNKLTSLDAGLFSGLNALTYLDLGYNELTNLDAGLFSGLTALTTLWLHENELTSLPDGLFDGLNALASLTLFDNSASLSITVSLEKVADGQFKAKAHTGAPFEIVLPVTVTNGTIDGGGTTVTILKGSIESDTHTVSRTSGTTAAVTVDIGILPGLPTDRDADNYLNHEGYVLVKSAALPLEVIAASQ